MPEPAERRPFLLTPGEGASVWSLGGRFTAKATAAVTEERFALVEALAFQSTEPPLHIHHREDEAWYILDGKMTFYVADEVLEATAGCFAFAPRGIPHTFTVDAEPTRVLLFAGQRGAAADCVWVPAVDGGIQDEQQPSVRRSPLHVAAPARWTRRIPMSGQPAR